MCHSLKNNKNKWLRISITDFQKISHQNNATLHFMFYFSAFLFDELRWNL